MRTTSAETSVSIHLLTNDTGCTWRHLYDLEHRAQRAPSARATRTSPARAASRLPEAVDSCPRQLYTRAHLSGGSVTRLRDRRRIVSDARWGALWGRRLEWTAWRKEFGSMCASSRSTLMRDSPSAERLQRVTSTSQGGRRTTRSPRHDPPRPPQAGWCRPQRRCRALGALAGPRGGRRRRAASSPARCG